MNVMVIMGLLTYCLIYELAISLLVVAVTTDTVIAMAILVVSINLYPIQDWHFWSSCGHHVTLLLTHFSQSLSKPWSLDTLWFTWLPFSVFPGGSMFYLSTKTSNQRHCTQGNNFGILYQFLYWNSFVHLSKAPSQRNLCGFRISLGNILLLAVFAKAVQVGDGAIAIL